MTEHEIEGERIDRKNEDLDAEVLVEPNALDPERHRREQKPAREHRQRNCGYGTYSPASQASNTLFLPNSPRARNVTTAISRRYIDSIDHSDA